MTLEMLPFYGVSLACIGLLSLFAHHNKRMGWVKQRQTVVQDLLALQSLWSESDAMTMTKPSSHATALAAAALEGAASPRETAEFTRQLGTLWNALEQQKVSVEAVNQHTTA